VSDKYIIEQLNDDRPHQQQLSIENIKSEREKVSEESQKTCRGMADMIKRMDENYYITDSIAHQ